MLISAQTLLYGSLARVRAAFLSLERRPLSCQAERQSYAVPGIAPPPEREIP